MDAHVRALRRATTMSDVDYDRLLILPPTAGPPPTIVDAIVSNPQSFHREAAWQGHCAVCGRTDDFWHAHQVVYQQHLRDLHVVAYDTRGALRLCIRDPTGRRAGDCHHAHHDGSRRVKGSELTDDNLAHVLWAHGGDHDRAAAYLQRYYDAPDAARLLATRVGATRADRRAA